MTPTGLSAEEAARAEALLAKKKPGS